MSETAPDEFLLHFARTAVPGHEPGRIGVAVSGGSDSMAALHLMHAAGWQVEAVTVDHGLRLEAKDEARFVAGACRLLGVPHTVLKWTDGPAPTGNLMEQAREARYRLIAGWARGRGLSHVAVAHTADDQAETFLMRLAREAGLDGLAAMRSSWDVNGVTFRRPFLVLDRVDLSGYLQRHGIAWIEDPTNSDDRYLRSRARRVLAALAPLGIDAHKLAGVAFRLGTARQGLEWAAAEVADRAVRIEAGDVILDRNVPPPIAPEIQRRLSIAALRFVSGAVHPPREGALQSLMFDVTGSRVRTLAGVRVGQDGWVLRFTREGRAVTGVECPTTDLWDGRWRLDGPHAGGLTIRALGAAGLILCKGWRDTGLPRHTLLVSPAVWNGDTLVAAPLAGWRQGWTAELAEGRNNLSHFLISH